MGLQRTWVAVRGSTPGAVQALLGLKGTGEREDFPESEFTGAELPGGWYIVVSDHDRLGLHSDRILSQLSRLGEVVVADLEEHVMYSSAERWVDGRQIWSVIHCSAYGIDHLEAKGDLPPSFLKIRDERQAEQQAAGPKPDVDYIIDIPLDLAGEFTGYRHDCDDEFGENAFEVLLGPPRKAWWRRLFGI